jgi:hypothetical protein
MPKYHFSVISEFRYPIETKGYATVSNWRAAAGKAVKAHLDEMKSRRKGQRVGDKLIIKLFRLPKENAEPAKDSEP